MANSPQAQQIVVIDMSKVIESRIYIVPLRDAWKASRKRRAERAVNILRNFAMRHMKANIVKISEEVNEFIWSRGIQNPPRRIKVLIEKDEDGTVRILLPKEERAE